MNTTNPIPTSFVTTRNELWAKYLIALGTVILDTGVSSAYLMNPNYHGSYDLDIARELEKQGIPKLYALCDVVPWGILEMQRVGSLYLQPVQDQVTQENKPIATIGGYVVTIGELRNLVREKKPFKVEVGQTTTVFVQQAILEIGCRWIGGGRLPVAEAFPYLVFLETAKDRFVLTWGNDRLRFERAPQQLVILSNALKPIPTRR